MDIDQPAEPADEYLRAVDAAAELECSEKTATRWGLLALEEIERRKNAGDTTPLDGSVWLIPTVLGRRRRTLVFAESAIAAYKAGPTYKNRIKYPSARESRVEPEAA